jgi:hypothetical protein
MLLAPGSWRHPLQLLEATGLRLKGAMLDLRPTVYAVALAVLATPLVAMTVTVYEAAVSGVGGGRYYSSTQIAGDDPRRYILALIAEVMAAIVGGYLGGLAVRLRFEPGVLFTYFVPRRRQSLVPTSPPPSLAPRSRLASSVSIRAVMWCDPEG